ncbi:MAG: Spy/CpxP family protein refolding chaperone [Caulobacteraceae bacterium]|nr:Spy/CpxP family protein refolding chaperone [Caulobacter sp.]
MLRISFPVLATALAVAGAAGAAQPGYDRSGYDQQAGYPQGAAPARPPAGYDRGYDQDDADPASPMGEAGGYTGGTQGGAPDLGRDLGLRPDQRAALQAYQQSTSPTAAQQQQMQADETRLASMNTPQRLDFISSQMRRDEADFAQRAAAVRRFYALLTPQQQRRFDQLTGPTADGGPGAGGDEGYDQRGSPPPR